MFVQMDRNIKKLKKEYSAWEVINRGLWPICWIYKNLKGKCIYRKVLENVILINLKEVNVIYPYISIYIYNLDSIGDYRKVGVGC